MEKNTITSFSTLPGKLIAVLGAVLCTSAYSAEEVATLLESALASNNPAISRVMQSASQHELQIMLTVIEREDGAPRLQSTTWGLDTNRYFYPASTVKFPLALMAAEFSAKHPDIDLTTPYRIEDGEFEYSLAQDIREIFLISDDEAYNRLYELFGRDAIGVWLNKKGLETTQIRHRLAVADSDAPHRRRIEFISGDQKISFTGKDSAVVPLEMDRVKKGRGYMADGKLVQKPMDFSQKNVFPIKDQHHLLLSFMLTPDTIFNLPQAEREVVLQAMHQPPRAAGYDESTYYDSYGKFLIFGDSKSRMPDRIQIHNKVGYAYGTLNDNAHVLDTQTGVEFVLTATILVNENGVFNDDQYQYDELGIPFLAELGREVFGLLLDAGGGRSDTGWLLQQLDLRESE